ncbi:MAG: hypothetical protein JWO56_2631 [Acidobacteria bacterium]|nr:hypothetical protein [Acidobacteriota bacterium]
MPGISATPAGVDLARNTIPVVAFGDTPATGCDAFGVGPCDAHRNRDLLPAATPPASAYARCGVERTARGGCIGRAKTDAEGVAEASQGVAREARHPWNRGTQGKMHPGRGASHHDGATPCALMTRRHKSRILRSFAVCAASKKPWHQVVAAGFAPRVWSSHFEILRAAHPAPALRMTSHVQRPWLVILSAAKDLKMRDLWRRAEPSFSQQMTARFLLIKLCARAVPRLRTTKETPASRRAFSLRGTEARATRSDPWSPPGSSPGRWCRG